MGLAGQRGLGRNLVHGLRRSRVETLLYYPLTTFHVSAAVTLRPFALLSACFALFLLASP
ncbi:hypothetical protein GUG97_20735, partial [Xanthomonas citri pv. citri]|nr:hypothetical protein [Xanthomonas citri pv. citri]